MILNWLNESMNVHHFCSVTILIVGLHQRFHFFHGLNFQVTLTWSIETFFGQHPCFLTRNCHKSSTSCNSSIPKLTQKLLSIPSLLVLLFGAFISNKRAAVFYCFSNVDGYQGRFLSSLDNPVPPEALLVTSLPSHSSSAMGWYSLPIGSGFLRNTHKSRAILIGS